MKKNQTFSMRARGRSFKYAFDGIIAFFQKEHNARIHFISTLLVFSAAFFAKVSRAEFAALFLSVGFVWSAEIFNTAIESLSDHISPQKDRRVKFIKDVSAAAVLIAAVSAVATSMVIFLPRMF
jgi:diacylglycerol kinase (ATP)